MLDIPGFTGRVITPGDEVYDEARRVWNGAVDRHPGVIAQCTGAADVLAALRCAREAGLLVAVRGGGHNVAGTAVCDDGLVIDLSPMRALHVDPGRRTARVEGGALWGDVDQVTQGFGLATPGGIVSHTGVAGLTLGGGIGWLMRKHGLTADNLTAADVVTADGQLRRASDEDDPDLLWALRGGGGNYGVVTSFTFRLHPVGPQVLAGPVLWPMEDTADVLRHYRDVVAGSAPPELTTIVNLRKAPPLPAIPAELHKRPVCAVQACWAGDLDAGERALRALRSYGRPLLDLVAPRPYTAWQSMFNSAVPHGWHYYWKSTNLARLEDAAIDVLAEHSLRVASPRSYTLLFHLGGAIADIGEDDTAYAHRRAAHNLNINGVWQPGEPIGDQERAWTRDFFTAIEPHRSGAYVNFLGEEGADRVRQAYGERTYTRLRQLKARYDPENVFRFNQNIPPAA
ncbi:FAD-binding oxidoreductase [Streptomyces flavidovirens]|uniref:FAD-binding oxidoreductase n=1 Tax=Streptomyces flavidovirens TaxID=67298 RepID=UPI0005698E09|nr:FAD-binding oxidoreductase [Streptomyces flavidovirens]